MTRDHSSSGHILADPRQPWESSRLKRIATSGDLNCLRDAHTSGMPTLVGSILPWVWSQFDVLVKFELERALEVMWRSSQIKMVAPEAKSSKAGRRVFHP